MSQNPQHAWLDRISRPNSPTISQAQKSSLGDIRTEFLVAATELLGMHCDEEAPQFRDIKGVTPEQYLRMNDEKPFKSIADDAVHYDENTQILTVAPFSLQTLLSDWFTEQLPSLMRPEFAIKIDAKKEEEIEANIISLAKEYQTYGLIDKDVALPASFKALHASLKKTFDTALALYTVQPPDTQPNL